MDAPKVTSESLTTAFWISFRSKPISAPTTLFYFFLIEKLKNNRWKPLVISDMEIANTLQISRPHIPEYRNTLKERGLLNFERSLESQKAPMTYFLPKPLLRMNRVCSVRNNDVTLETSAVTTAVDDLAERRRLASIQGEELLRVFFDPSSRRSIEVLCMQNRLTEDELRGIARRVVDDWIMEGRTHDRFGGGFDVSEAIRHLRMTIPKKTLAESLAAECPKSRNDKRRELMMASYAGLRQAIDNDRMNNPDNY